jgi:putative ABC transport system permease protein
MKRMRTESLGTSYLALPDGPAPYPGVVVIHEASGLNDNILPVVHRVIQRPMPAPRCPGASDSPARVRTGPSAQHRISQLKQLPPATYTISGIATWGSADSPLGATITAFDPATATRVLGQSGMVDSINVEGAPGVSQAQLVSRLQSVIHNPKIEVVSGQAITVEGQNTIHQALKFINVFLLVFAFIALFVGSFVIFNTFSIIVAQRMRELALLRAVGASRVQMMASVLGESLVIGVLASAAGLAAGIGLAVVLKAGLAALGFDLPATGLVVSLRTVIVGIAAGTLITVVSALSPARRASRIPPVAAMRDVAAEPRQLSARRIVRGAILTAGGAAVLGWGLFAGTGNRVTLVGAGAVAVFLGISILGPFVARPVSRILGAPLAMRTTGRLAQQNAMRNPSRTAATASALMVGVALVSLMTIVASSTKASVNSIINSAVRADFVISSGGIAGGSSGFSPDLERSLNALPQVSATTGIRSGVVQLYGKPTPIVATNPDKASQLLNIGVAQGRLASMTPSGIAIVAAMHSQGITHLVFPIEQLLALATLAGLAGIVAAIVPSRHAARLDVLQAVTTE